MYPRHRAAIHQQQRIRRYAECTDSYSFFNLLTAPQLLDTVESLLPEHRERLFPPTETLSMFLAQAMNADGSCQKAVNDAAVKRLVCGLKSCSTHTGAYCRARQRLPVGMVCLTSGAVLDAAIGKYRGKGGDEQTLLRSMLSSLDEGDILLGDALYATYFLLCELQRRQIDGVFEQHGARKRSTDFDQGRHLGHRDHLIEITKPKHKPGWMSQEQ